ncbi:hypothetical protein AGRA3207_006141 [Actinomadura graeca]|uniref:Tetratricopeptide repeat protein n=1 Tax=Actinomadura graeca TaxID=2750812 RepID=A0ABX8R119_9ACTN|nr:hypothetical protein [Actinomadura graeca]QXJ24750.1 hypothetical protein AGRA3207_006141 [Actinomadura graeca]
MWRFGQHDPEPVLPPDAAIDPCMDDPGAQRVREAMRRHDWSAVTGFFETVTDPDDRAFYIGVCAGAPGVRDWIAEWCRARPGDTLPSVIRGAHALSSDAPALAEECLNEVVARDAGDAAAWSLLVGAARVGGLGRKEALRRFEQVVAVHPGHLAGHREMLAYLGHEGGHGEALGFAHDAAGASPEGGPLGVLVADAHVGRWESLPPPERNPYMSGSAVRGDLVAAADRSVRHAAFRARPGWPAIHNAFAFAFVMAGEPRLAAEMFERIGHRATERPWAAYGPDPVAAFRELRRWAVDWA